MSLAEILMEAVREVEPALRPDEITPTASITWDLGLDSMRLARLFQRLEARGLVVDGEDWVLAVGVNGQDTVESLRQHLQARNPAA